VAASSSSPRSSRARKYRTTTTAAVAPTSSFAIRSWRATRGSSGHRI
jgi:hypothetical protein